MTATLTALAPATIPAKVEAVLARTLTPGARVTQVDTPDGPWYTVVQVGKGTKRLTLTYRTDEGDTFSITGTPTSQVLLEVAPAREVRRVALPEDPREDAAALEATFGAQEDCAGTGCGSPSCGSCGDGMVPSTGRNLVAEKRERLDRAAAGKGKRSSRKSGDPRADRTRGLAVDASTPGTLQALVQPLSPVAYPEALEGAALCHGACGEVRPVTRFPFIANKGDGKGRMVECGPCQVARLARNKAARAAGAPLEPKPRAAL